MVPVPALHILTVIEAPALFGLTTESIKEAYERHNEPIGHEGFAREEIMIGLINKGWIRARFVVRTHTWTTQASTDNKDTMDRIEKWRHKVPRSSTRGLPDVSFSLI